MVNKYCVCTYIVRDAKNFPTRVMDVQAFPNPAINNDSLARCKERAKILRELGKESVEPAIYFGIEENESENGTSNS